MRYSYSIAYLAAALIMIPPAALAQARFIDKSAKPGQTINLISFLQYQQERGCTPLASGDIDGYPKPKLGSLFSQTRSINREGPCGKKEYPVQLIQYRAGSATGVDEFELFVYSSAFFGGGPIQSYKVRVSIGGKMVVSDNRIANKIATDVAPKTASERSSKSIVNSNNSSQSHQNPKPSNLPDVTRNIFVTKGNTVRAGFTYHLDNDCKSQGDIIFRTILPPQGGKVAFVKERGFSNYSKDDIRSSCNQKASEIFSIYYEAPAGEAQEEFTVEAFYPNGNKRKWLVRAIVQ